MLNKLSGLMHPERFQGNGKQPPYFEGWFFKLVDAGEKHRVALIPGISLSADPAQSHAFIQVLDGNSGRALYARYPLEQFQCAKRSFNLRIGANRFSSDHLHVDIVEQGWRLEGALSFAGLTPWPVRWFSPGIMGWYAWMPFMQCYHGIISLDHEISGSLVVNGETIDFSHGRGYGEKDWGSSFPQAYIWVQSNHFDEPGASLIASVAIIPWLRGAFPGFIIGLHHRNRLLRFATYTGAAIEELAIDDSAILCRIRSRRHRLIIEALRADGGLLHAPGEAGMTTRIAETLGGRVRVRLESLDDGSCLFDQSGRHCGIDAAGDLAALLRLWKTAGQSK